MLTLADFTEGECALKFSFAVILNLQRLIRNTERALELNNTTEAANGSD